jgi:hypothetical protein
LRMALHSPPCPPDAMNKPCYGQSMQLARERGRRRGGGGASPGPGTCAPDPASPSTPGPSPPAARAQQDQQAPFTRRARRSGRDTGVTPVRCGGGLGGP